MNIGDAVKVHRLKPIPPEVDVLGVILAQMHLGDIYGCNEVPVAEHVSIKSRL